MSQAQILPSASPSVSLYSGRPATTSLEVARFFGKRHDDVVKSIRNLSPSCPAEFSARNFAGAEYTDDQGKSRPMFILYRDGFTLLAMGYTGKRAMQFKVAYIEAFNAIERQLAEKALPPSSPSLTPSTPSDRKSLRALVNAWAGIANVQHNLLWLQILAHFQIDRINDLPVEWIPRAIAWVQERIDTISVPRTLPEQKPLPAAPALPASPCFDEHDIQSFAEELRHWHQEVRRRILTLTGRYQQCGMPVLMEAMRRIEGGTFKKSVQISSFNRMLFDQGFFMIEAIPGCRNETLPDSNNPAMYLIDFARALNAK